MSLAHEPIVLPPRPVDVAVAPIRAFARHKLAGAVLLIGATVTALALANSPFSEAFLHALHTPISFSVGTIGLEKSLLHWINDGLMGIFFFAVGLEIKSEVKVGELSTLRKAGLPAIAAVGGMALPGAIYAIATQGDAAASSGWGIPMATDIAFALGVLALLGDRVPTGLKVFLTALAIVDDIGAVLIIAVFYTDTVSLVSLGVAAGFLLAGAALNAMRVRSTMAYLIVGIGAWLAFLNSGVHATIAALLMALLIPARTRLDGAQFVEAIEADLERLRRQGPPRDHELNTSEQQQVIESMAMTVARADAPLSKLEHALAPLVTFLVLPVFAVANAGVTLPSEPSVMLGQVTTWAVALGLVVGKPLGITLFTLVGVRSGVVELPSGVRLPHIIGAGLLAGVGFTMALFIGGLAFEQDALVQQAKFGTFAGSTIAAFAGYLWLRAYGTQDASTQAAPARR